MIKNKYILLISAWLLFISAPQAEENKINLNLIDKGEKTILKEHHNNGFFNEEMYSVKIVKSFKDFVPTKGDITLNSNIIKKDGKKVYFYKLHFPTTGGKKMYAEWALESTEDNNEFGELALENSLDFATKSRNTNPNSFFSDNTMNSGFSDIEVEYDKDNRVKSYNLTYSNTPSQDHRFWRTVAQISMFSLIGEVNYWITKDDNVEDWEYRPTPSGFKEKIVDGWSLDTNNFRTNTIFHAYAGALYYQSARSNGYGYGESAMFSFFGSLLWEYAGEFREQVSTNDMIWTPFAGSILGEGMRQMSIFAEENMRPGFLRNIVMFAMDPMRVVNKYLDSKATGGYRLQIYFETPVHRAVKDYSNDIIANQ